MVGALRALGRGALFGVDAFLGRTFAMRTWLRAVVWVTSLAMVSCALLAQTVTTTNEVRAMRGLGPIEGVGNRGQGIGEKVELPTVEELEG